MSNQELEILAELVVEKLKAQQSLCHLTEKEQQAVRDLIQTKRNAVKAFLWLIGALCIWILKDVYMYIVNHLTWMNK